MTTIKSIRKFRTAALGIATIAAFSTVGWAADDGPGAGVSVQPVATGRADQNFQNFIVQIGLERLGYDVQTQLEAQYPAMHLAIGQGDGDYTSTHWDPLHEEFYERAGGDEKLARVGELIKGAAQGYLIDKKSADAHGITNIEQLQDPEIAKLFDSDGDGRANLTGCNPGWGCEAVIEHHMEAYALQDTVQHDQGEYFALIANTLTRYQNGDPIFYYTWTPLWVSSVLKPGEDTVWLDVPFSSLPGDRDDIDTSTPDGHNRGFQVNSIRVMANKNFLAKNPAAERLFEVMELPLEDVNEAILKQRDGEDTIEQIRAHAEQWVADHVDEFGAWVEEAKSAAK